MRHCRFIWLMCALGASVGCEDGVDRITNTSAFSSSGIMVAGARSTILAGQSVQLTATVDGRPGEFHWESLTPRVASVDATGRVTCHDIGSAIILVTQGSDFPQERQVLITCELPPPFVTIVNTTLEFEHRIGLSPCPHVVGGSVVTNPGSEAVTVTIAPRPPLRAAQETVVVLPGASVTIPILFDCSVRTPTVRGSLSVIVRSADGRVQRTSIAVSGLVY